MTKQPETFDAAVKRLGIEEDPDVTQTAVFMSKRALDASKQQVGQIPKEEK